MLKQNNPYNFKIRTVKLSDLPKSDIRWQLVQKVLADARRGASGDCMMPESNVGELCT